jgi:hypothetical protein
MEEDLQDPVYLQNSKINLQVLKQFENKFIHVDNDVTYQHVKSQLEIPYILTYLNFALFTLHHLRLRFLFGFFKKI